MFNNAYQIKGSQHELHELDEALITLCAQANLAEESYGIRLAVTEALSAVVDHAYEDAPSSPIDIQVQCDDAKVEITITDHGNSLLRDDLHEVESVLGTELSGGLPDDGWGIYVMQTYMDDVRYEPGEKQNTWTLVKSVAS